MEYKDYYQILAVDKKATQDEIKRSYRKLARKYHPDLNSSSDAEDHFKEVGEAYEVLKDPEKRAAYDQLGASWKSGQSGFQPPPGWDEGFEFHGGGYTDGSNANFSDFFESLFGQHAGFRYGPADSGQGANINYGQARGQDSHARVFIELEDAYHGATRSMTLHSTEIGADGRPRVKLRTLNVKIPKGVKEGQNIRLQGQGNPGFGGARVGDLYLEIGFNPHSLYRVKGHDVFLELAITPWEAALGGTIQVPTPAGKVDLKIPPGSSSGKRMRLKGRGIPAKTKGDFFLTLEIVLPDKISEKQKSLYQALQHEAGHFNPRAKLGV